MWIEEDPTLVMEYIAENIPREYKKKDEIKRLTITYQRPTYSLEEPTEAETTVTGNMQPISWE